MLHKECTTYPNKTNKQNKNIFQLFFEILTKVYHFEVQLLLDTTMAKKQLFILILNLQDPTGGQADLRPFCQADLWLQSSQCSSTEDLTLNLGTKCPQKEKVSETQPQGWLYGLVTVVEITEKYNKRDMKDAH